MMCASLGLNTFVQSHTEFTVQYSVVGVHRYREMYVASRRVRARTTLSGWGASAECLVTLESTQTRWCQHRTEL